MPPLSTGTTTTAIAIEHMHVRHYYSHSNASSQEEPSQRVQAWMMVGRWMCGGLRSGVEEVLWGRRTTMMTTIAAPETGLSLKGMGRALLPKMHLIPALHITLISHDSATTIVSTFDISFTFIPFFYLILLC
jgi:hypothetical protein